MAESPIYANDQIDVPKPLTDIVEALIGAVWLDTQRNTFSASWRLLLTYY